MIKYFEGEYRYLSNFWPCRVELEDIVYPSSEHAFVAYKTTNIELRKIIAEFKTAGKVKRAGRQLHLRPDWEDVKVDVMRKIVTAKFDQNPDLKEKLLATRGMELIEGNTWHDTFWGQCPIGVGKNMLGKILMEYRDNPFTESDD